MATTPSWIVTCCHPRHHRHPEAQQQAEQVAHAASSCSSLVPLPYELCQRLLATAMTRPILSGRRLRLSWRVLLQSWSRCVDDTCGASAQHSECVVTSQQLHAHAVKLALGGCMQHALLLSAAALSFHFPIAPTARPHVQLNTQPHATRKLFTARPGRLHD